MKTGFVGLGLMGSRMAERLLARGIDLVVHNRTPAKARPLLAGGAQWASSAAETAARSDVVFTMLSTPSAVEEVALSPGGLLEGLRAGSLWADCSTVDPSFSRRLAAEAAGRGAKFLDAPVAGSIVPAQKGELVFLVGGEEADVDRCRPLLSAMGKTVVRVGGQGMGSSMKMTVNLLLAAGMAAFAEALALGRSLGIDDGTLFQTLVSSPVTAPFLAAKRDRIEHGDYDPEFPLKWMQKDLRLVSATAAEGGVALPLAGLLKEVYQLAARQGLAEADFSAICLFLAGDGGEAGTGPAGG